MIIKNISFKNKSVSLVLNTLIQGKKYMKLLIKNKYYKCIIKLMKPIYFFIIMFLK